MEKKTVLSIVSMLMIVGFVSICFSPFVVMAQPISPTLIGSNVWMNPGDAQWATLTDLGVKIMRVGGAAYDRRMPSDSQLMTWISAIKKMGAQPLIQVPQYGEERAANAARIVKLFNIDNPEYYVKYWGIGNEPWLQAGKPAFPSIIATIEGYYKEIAPSMKAVDPNIKIYGPDMCYYESQVYDALFGGPNDIAGKIPGKNYYYTDGLSWHRYVGGDLAHKGLEDFHKSIVACKARVDYANNLHNRTGDDALGWGIGEFNSNAGNGGTVSFAAGQMFAGIYMYCMLNAATFTTNWSIKEGGSSGSGTDFGLLNRNNSPRSTAAHMQMVTLNMNGEYVSGTSSDREVLVFGSKNPSKICAMIVNRSENGQKYTIRLDNKTVSQNQLTLNIDSGIPREYSNHINGNESQLIVFSSSGIPLEKWTYNSEMNGKWADREIIQIETPAFGNQ